MMLVAKSKAARNLTRDALGSHPQVVRRWTSVPVEEVQSKAWEDEETLAKVSICFEEERKPPT
jgi:hypothetical protein